MCCETQNVQWKDVRVGSVLQGPFDARLEEFSAALNLKSTEVRGFLWRPGSPLP
jgi:hypothetical protein